MDNTAFFYVIEAELADEARYSVLNGPSLEAVR